MTLNQLVYFQTVARYQHFHRAAEELNISQPSLSRAVATLEEELREKHIERLSAGKCDPSAGVVFLDLISNLERISDHAYNLAGYVKDEM